ncbi:MAG: alpha/beta hydrolase [Gemmatimonadales bacterium]
MTIREAHLTVQRTARYASLGPAGPAAAEAWFVCHGYGQRAAAFLEAFLPLDDGRRLVVAPEALSRFYLDSGPSGRHGEQVGASWMTREDRECEIDDYVRYLEALRSQVLAPIGRSDVAVRVLGFSQGVATAARWVLRAAWKPDQLILWGGLLPPELIPEEGTPFPEVRLTFVSGERDPAVDQVRLAQQVAALRSRGARVEQVSFAGAHRLDTPTLLRLAGADE